MTNVSLRALVVEDSEDDAVLIVRLLKKQWPDAVCRRVETWQECQECLCSGQWDVVISDFNVQAFNGLEVLREVRRQRQDLPFILVSGTIGEEAAVEVMKAGAHDYIMKDRMNRLVPAIEREMREHRLRGEHRQAEQALKKWGHVVMHAHWGIVVVDSSTKCIESANPAFATMYGYTQGELEGKSIWQLFAHSTPAPSEAELFNAEHSSLECMHARKDGADFPVQMDISAYKDHDGTIRYYSVYVQDITRRKLAEDRLRSSLAEKEVLLRELHHRVKNNLALVSSLLSLQSMYIKDPALAAVFKESRGRIKTMAMVHERIYQAQDLGSFSLEDYVRHLAADLLQAYRLAYADIDATVEVNATGLDLDAMVPCGLIINELVTNVLKHAFTPQGGQLRVSFNKTPEGQYEITVSDNGKGLPAEVDIEKPASLGLMIVSILVQQLAGHISIDRAGGTSVTVSFARTPRPTAYPST